MARLPTAPELGYGDRPASTRPTGTFDATPIARGAAAIGHAYEDLGQAEAKQGQSIAASGTQMGAGLERFGSGVEKLGAGLGDYANSEDRFEYAKAHADFLSRKIDLDAAIGKDQNYGPDDAGKDLPTRYKEQLNGIRASSSNMIQDPRWRELFINQAQPSVEQGVVQAQSHARALSNDAQVAYVAEMGNKSINQAIVAKDDETRTAVIDAHNQLVDGLASSGAISSVAAVKMKQDWAHQYATADVLARADSDPQGVINELRARPGSSDAITNRILTVEGEGANGKSSAKGHGQFIESTWLDVLKRNRPDLAEGRSDDELLAMRSDKSLGRQMVDSYQKENAATLKAAGIEASPANLYLAHFLGPGGAKAVLSAPPNMPVADALAKALGPEKAQAMIAANPKVLQGQLAGSVKQWADGLMGGSAPGGGSIYDMLRPDVREQLLSHAMQKLQTNNVQELSAFKRQIEDSQAEAMRTGEVKSPLKLSDFIGNLGADLGPKVYKGYQANVQLGRDIVSVSSLSPDQQRALLATYEPKPGEGFSEAVSREDALKKAIATSQISRAKDPDFKGRVESTLAEGARNGGKVGSPVTADEFEFHLGPDAGPKAYAQYTSSLRLGRDAQHAGELTPEEQGALLKGYEPKPGDDYVPQQERQQALAKAISTVNKERADDPAGFAVNRLPAAAQAYRAYGATQGNMNTSPGERAVAARSFAATTLLAQQGAGISADDRKILPAGDVERLKKTYDDAVASPDAKARVGLIAAVQAQKAMWGDYWPDVVRQMTPAMQPMVRAIAAGADTAAMARLLSLDPKENPSAVLKEQSETKSSDLRKALNTELSPLLATMVGRQRDRDFFDYYNLSDKLAALYVRDGKDASTAAHDAFNALIGNRYDFRDSFRIPKESGVAADDVHAGALAAKTRLAELGAKPAIDDVGGLTDAARDSLDKFRRDGVWVTSPDNGGLNLMYGDKAVRDGNGQPLFLSWSRLAQIGGTREARDAATRSAAEGSFAP